MTNAAATATPTVDSSGNPLPLSTDPIDIALDPITGKLPPTGDLVMSTGIAAVAQGALIRIRMVAGEWFANLDAGVRWIARDGVTPDQAILGQKYDAAKAIGEIRRVLLGDATTPGVPGVLDAAVSCDFEPSTRQSTITWSLSTAFGDTPPDTLSLGM